mmetsp:Transcript_2696/g.4029  ORF Transcript_2696/g.4029 Transcript_2696/m.4029 type:complete len:447 (+) Transcript_2696:86-1426(+)
MGLGMSCFACAACSGICSLFSSVCSCAGCLCGASKDTPKDLMVGKIRSMILIILTIVLAIFGQYYFSDFFSDHLSAWTNGCDGNEDCVGNTAVYRVSLVDSIFFFVMALGALSSSLFNNRFWSIKLFFIAAMLVGSIFISNEVFDDRGFVWVARFGAFFFIIMQQLVLIDIAYSWNDSWVERADTSENRWLLIILVILSCIFFATSLVGIGFLFEYFRGCPENELILSLSLILMVLATAVQLLGLEGNLLTTSIVCCYSVFLAFTSVSKNPNEECNPLIGNSQNLTSQIIGLILTIISLIWICGQAGTSVTKLLGGDTPPTTVASVENVEKKLNGDGSDHSPSNNGAPLVAGSDDPSNSSEEPVDYGDGWKFNIVMMLLSMFFGMMLTNWGVIQTYSTDSSDTSSYSDPKNGEAAMWIAASSQWICISLYIWTLVAPRLFPDRDFS